MLKGRSEKFSPLHICTTKSGVEKTFGPCMKCRNPIKDKKVDLSRRYELTNKEKLDHEVDLILSHEQREVVLTAFHCLELTSDETDLRKKSGENINCKCD